jgi:hypothetical protein
MDMKATTERANNQNRPNQFTGEQNRGMALVCRSIRLPSPQMRNIEVRAYFRDLHAAEMLAWERSGGDFLVSERQ